MSSFFFLISSLLFSFLNWFYRLSCDYRCHFIGCHSNCGLRNCTCVLAWYLQRAHLGIYCARDKHYFGQWDFTKNWNVVRSFILMNFVLKYSKCARSFKKMTFKLSSTHGHLFTLSFVHFFPVLSFSSFPLSSVHLFMFICIRTFTLSQIHLSPIHSFTRSFIRSLSPYFSWFIRSLIHCFLCYFIVSSFVLNQPPRNNYCLSA